MRRILVTGAAGFLGKSLVSQLKSAGHWISVIGHGVTDCYGFDPHIHVLGEEIVESNLCRVGASVDVVYHFAGTSSVVVAQNDPAMDRQKSLVPTQELLHFVEKHSPKSVFFYSSSAAVYGNVPNDRAVVEDTVLKPISVYGETKVACEQAVLSSSLSAVIVRFFSIYGAGLQKQLFWDACNKIHMGDHHFYGAGNAYRDWIHVRDAVRLMGIVSEQTLNDGEKLILNGANGQKVWVSTALQHLFVSLGSRNTPIFDRGDKTGDPTGQCADISKITALGYQASVTLEEGLEDYAQWFLRHKLDPLQKET